MPKFIFKLQPVLDLKTQMEDSLKNELGKAVQKLEREKDKLLQLDRSKVECVFQFNKRSSGGAAVARLREYGMYLSFLRGKIELQKENINYAQNIVDKYREQLIKVVQEKEMLEKLKNKKYEEHMKEQFRDEQKLVDEIVSYKHNKVLAGEKNG